MVVATPRPDAPLIFVVSGPSGAGKGTIVERLVLDDPTLWLSRSWTTRSRRKGESPHAYRFVDRPTFEDLIERDGLVEYAEVFGNLYGTPVPTPPAGCDVVLEIDVQGAQQVRTRFPDAILVFVAPPTRVAQEARLRGRGTETEDQIARRLAKADAEEAIGEKIADYWVTNDELARAVAEVAGIVEGHRSRRGTPTGGPPAVPAEGTTRRLP